MAAIGAVACIKLIPLRRTGGTVEQLPARSIPAEVAA
jgi:hypothetical protein